MSYVCPVCGYSRLEHPATDFTICASCGTEFELDDEVRTHAQLRQEWLRRGAPWFSQEIQPPPGWHAYRLQQLAGAFVDVDDSTQSVKPTTFRVTRREYAIAS